MSKRVRRISVEAPSFQADVREIVSRAYEAARRLADVGAMAGEAAHDVFFDDGAATLRAQATQLRCGASQTLLLAAELLTAAARLEQIAATYDAAGRR